MWLSGEKVVYFGQKPLKLGLDLGLRVAHLLQKTAVVFMPAFCLGC
jgi:hypothetical protein